MLRMSVNVLPILKEKGYSTYKLRKDKVLSESTIQKLRKQIIPSLDCLDWLCSTLNLQPSQLIEYVDNKE